MDILNRMMDSLILKVGGLPWIVTCVLGHLVYLRRAYFCIQMVSRRGLFINKRCLLKTFNLIFSKVTRLINEKICFFSIS